MPSIKVNFQNRDKFWNNKLIKPDIVISKPFLNDGAIEIKHFVIDTKWKIKEVAEPDDDDLKQMYVYNMYWESEKSMLLYPTTNIKNTSFGKFHKGRDGENLCKLGFVKVMNGKDLNLEIGKEIFLLLDIK